MNTLNKLIRPVIHRRKINEYLRSMFCLDWEGIHGPIHWGRVLKNGLLLAEKEGARKDVVTLFALFHDHQRLDEGLDREHGPRAADIISSYRGEYFEIDNEGLDLLIHAIRYHSDGMTEGDVTVRVCWDADRLDLGRVGIRPLAPYLCTNTAKDPIFLEEAYIRSVTGKDTEQYR